MAAPLQIVYIFRSFNQTYISIMRFLTLDSQCKKIKEQTNAHTYIQGFYIRINTHTLYFKKKLGYSTSQS